MECSYCELQMLEEQPKCTLMCGHTIHTRCLLLHSMRHYLEDLSCRECDTIVVSREIHREANPQPTHGTCKNLEETSEEFRNGLKTLIEKHKEAKKYKSAISKKIRAVEVEYKLFIKPQVSILKNYRKDMMRKLTESEDYKTASSKMSAYTRYISTFMNTHNLSRNEMWRYLESNYNIIYPSRWGFSLRCVLERKFRIRI